MSLTYFLAELIGLYLLLIGLLMLAQRKMFIEIVDEFYRTRVTLFIGGFIAMLLGLLIVLNHNYWNAGFLALLITLIGWTILLKGAAILFIPQTTVAWVRAIKLQKFFYVYAAIVLVIGLYLVHAGFTHAGLLQ